MDSASEPSCPKCGLVLLVDAPINIIFRWPEITADYDRVAVIGGWGGVLAATSSLGEASAVYFGDLITSAAVCPRCGTSVFDVLRRDVDRI